MDNNEIIVIVSHSVSPSVCCRWNARNSVCIVLYCIMRYTETTYGGSL